MRNREMSPPASKDKLLRIVPWVLLYLWWFLLSGNYLYKFWSNPLIAGADGSGHVAMVHLYAKHVYPNLHGWIPELFGGMPFPVFYPPLFYWSGATLMLVGIDATVAAKLLTTFSFVTLPAALWLLGRKVGLTAIEASIAAGAGGVAACGSNIVSLSGIGLLGLFEVGLFTQTLGFVFFCLWAAYLPGAGRSVKGSVCAIVFLIATISSNAHILPLVAIYALMWFLTKLRWTRNKSPLVLRAALTLLPLAGPLLICGIWLTPLLRWYSYSVGQVLSSAGLFTSLGSLNIVWPLCGYAGWREKNRRPYLTSLCATILITAAITLTPFVNFLKYIPFQPPRVIAGALLLCTIPLTKMASRILTESLGGRRWATYTILTVCTLALGWLHPIQKFGIGALTLEDAKSVEAVRVAVRELPPGKLLIEIVEPKAIFNSPESRTMELARSRALTHEIARDGRPVLWSIFREQSIMAPYATAVTNLFSSTKETFGLNGVALQRSSDESVSLENRLLVATKLNVAYFLVKTPKQVEALSNTPGVRMVWTIHGWSLFANSSIISNEFQTVVGLPIFAWMKANTKDRKPADLDLFNLGEQLALEGHPELLPLWATCEGIDAWEYISNLQSAIVVIDPAAVSSNQQSWLAQLLKHPGKLRVILLDDGSQLAAQLNEKSRGFASYTHVTTPQLSSVVTAISAQATTLTSASEKLRLWHSSSAYFPSWRTSDGQATFLTGQGTTAVFSAAQPSLSWHSRGVRLLSLVICGLGLILCSVYLRSYSSR
jgi:hypothetical protein